MAEREGEPARKIAFVGNSQQMLRDIKQSLRHLKRQPEQQRPETTRISQQPATSAGSNSVTVGQHAEPNTTKPMAQNSSRRISHAKALAEIRSSLKPFETTESGYSSCSESGESINKQFLSQLKALGFDEVRNMELCLNLIRSLLLGHCILKFVMFHFMFHVYNSFAAKVLRRVNGFTTINSYRSCMSYIYVSIKYTRGISFVSHYVASPAITRFAADVIILTGTFSIFSFNA